MTLEQAALYAVAEEGKAHEMATFTGSRSTVLDAAPRLHYRLHQLTEVLTMRTNPEGRLETVGSTTTLPDERR